jgi:hypothetical protein
VTTSYVNRGAFEIGIKENRARRMSFRELPSCLSSAVCVRQKRSSWEGVCVDRVALVHLAAGVTTQWLGMHWDGEGRDTIRGLAKCSASLH